MTVAEILRTARALYEANPSHAPYGDPVGEGLCVIYALSEAAVEADNYVEARGAVARAVEVADESPAEPLVTWNAEHTTEEVLTAFDRAIEAEEASA